jgi:hypothetical protein
VVAKEPYFPRRVGDEEKRTILNEILDEFVRYLIASKFRVDRNGPRIEVTSRCRGWWGGEGRTWCMRVITDPVGADSLVPEERADVLLSLHSLPLKTRDHLDDRRVAWVDIESKERSGHGNDLAEEIIHYLKRHGVRLLRVRAR